MPTTDESQEPVTPPCFDDSLGHVSNGGYSQWGEDLILSGLLERLGIDRGYCVEFGAWNGVLRSNTYNLIRNRGWSGLHIESNPTRFQELQHNMQQHAGVTCLQRVVGFDGPNRLDAILNEVTAPADFELLSIDIDGNDYHVWSAMESYRPKVVVIEFNPSIPNHIAFIQPRDEATKHGSSARALAELGERKGYRPVAATLTNLVLVRTDVADMASLPVLPLDLVRTDHTLETSVLHLYDGTLKVVGPTRGVWNGIRLRFLGMQTLPRFLRVYPPDANFWQAGLVRLARREADLRGRLTGDPPWRREDMPPLRTAAPPMTVRLRGLPGTIPSLLRGAASRLSRMRLRSGD